MTTTDGTVHSPPSSTTAIAAAPIPAPDAHAPAGEQADWSQSQALRSNSQLSRSQVLDATEECLMAQGYDGTTIRRIAAILGCSVGSIYRFFTDKRQLLDAVAQRRFRPVVEHVRARQKPHRTALLYAQVAADQPEVYRLMFWLASIGATRQAPALPAIIRQIIDGWATQLGSTQAAEAFWCQLHGQLMLGHDPIALTQSLNQNTTAAATPSAPTPTQSLEPVITATAPAPRVTSMEDVTLL